MTVEADDYYHGPWESSMWKGGREEFVTEEGGLANTFWKCQL